MEVGDERQLDRGTSEIGRFRGCDPSDQICLTPLLRGDMRELRVGLETQLYSTWRTIGPLWNAFHVTCRVEISTSLFIFRRWNFYLASNFENFIFFWVNEILL